MIEAEVKALSNLADHDNVLRMFESGRKMYEKKDKSKSREVSYIVLEICAGGELFDFVAESGPFSEDMARYYTKQMFDGLEYVHRQGFAHRDLKPENLFMDEHFNLKVADFGFSAQVEGKTGDGHFTTKLGTLNYMAPEIHLRQPYLGRKTDIFAAAIILFILVSGHPPFTTAEPKDPFYKCLAASRADIFWKTHCKTKEGGLNAFSPEFRDII
jgi:serine/threonine protein kinase